MLRRLADASDVPMSIQGCKNNTIIIITNIVMIIILVKTITMTIRITITIRRAHTHAHTGHAHAHAHAHGVCGVVPCVLRLVHIIIVFLR